MAKLELEITDSLEARLREAAEREGVTVYTLATRKLLESFGDDPVSPNLIDFLGDFVGAGHGTGAVTSENMGEQFTDYLVEKKRNGSL